MGGGKVIEGRRTADADGAVVVFLIGMRINRLRSVRSWLPVFVAMPRMVRELYADPESGLLAARLVMSGPREFGVVQYWRSTEHLFDYAVAPGRQHRPAWAAFNRRVRKSRGSVGIWHETYRVPAGGYESIYADMPEYGLAAAHGAVPVAARGEGARQRMAAADSSG
ncbi:DUF4188 domain-containing protein [Streptomyces boncukensis]|uniref:DUF4188 domain-containing protein n=1 Tax=Streptomyces boncukensis TaxID=2711219 RepID=A0A6G4WP93_9ACTN|nr:DUF4188 domain-containing protein [Streptomyces boncukensis]NGO67086.1 DUF4188 domain-containing protein [Streptomyces boncukensis]